MNTQTPTNNNYELDAILTTSPTKNVPDDIWETIHATWTGLWTDAYGEWDELQASDIFPISELLSSERELWLKQAIHRYTQKMVVAELKRIKEGVSLPPDCPSDCVKPDPTFPRQQHWHHVTHGLLDDRITAIEREMEKS